MGLGIHNYQDQIQELSCQVTQPIKGAFGVLGLHLGKAKDMILVFLEKVMGLPKSLPTEESPDRRVSRPKSLPLSLALLKFKTLTTSESEDTTATLRRNLENNDVYALTFKITQNINAFLNST